MSQSQPKKLLVVMPAWVGDTVMAMPSIGALRRRFADAHIATLVRPHLKPLLDACPLIDRMISWRKPRPGSTTRSRRANLALASRLRNEGFDTAVLLPNSLRSAVLLRIAGVPRRVGYRRDARGPLLTDRLEPLRADGKFAPISAVDYYLKLVEHLGAAIDEKTPKLWTHPVDDVRARKICDAAEGEGPLVLLNPGAATKGSAKLWPATRFAELADALDQKYRARILLNGGPAEAPILESVQRASKVSCVNLLTAGGSLRLLKSVLAQCDLAVSNDTGGRHIAAAMGTGVVSLFGPTDPAWAALVGVREQVICSETGQMDQIGLHKVMQSADKYLRSS
jgi:heptosyltransferase-2